MMASTSCSQVSKKDAIGGGILHAISAICSSDITPGPLGILDTSPSAAAPYWIASCASGRLAMQQIFTLGLAVGCMLRGYQSREPVVRMVGEIADFANYPVQGLTTILVAHWLTIKA